MSETLFKKGDRVRILPVRTDKPKVGTTPTENINKTATIEYHVDHCPHLYMTSIDGLDEEIKRRHAHWGTEMRLLKWYEKTVDVFVRFYYFLFN